MRMLLILFSFACFALAYDHNLYIENVKRVRNSLPTGTVLIWWTQADVPEDFIECDGRPVPEGTELRKLMSHTPNYVGKFLKGRDEGERAGDTKPPLVLVNSQNYGKNKLNYGIDLQKLSVKETFPSDMFLSSYGNIKYFNYPLSRKSTGLFYPYNAWDDSIQASFFHSKDVSFVIKDNMNLKLEISPTDIDGLTPSQSKTINKKRTIYQNGKFVTKISSLHFKEDYTSFGNYGNRIDFSDFHNVINLNTSNLINNKFDIQYKLDNEIGIRLYNGKVIKERPIISETEQTKPQHVNTRYIIKL